KSKLDLYFKKFESIFETVKAKIIDFGIINRDFTFDIAQVKKLITKGLDIALSTLKETTSYFTSFMLFIFYLFFLLPGIRNFKIKINRAFDKQKAEKINAVNDKILSQIQKYITAKSFISFITGLFVYITCLFFNIDFPLIWGVLTFLLNFIPNIGSILASIFPIILSILQFYDPELSKFNSLKIISFSSIIIGAQIIIGNVLEPKLLAKTLSLSSLVVFIALVFWGWIWEMAGVILSVPIMVTISIICQNIPSLKPIALFLQSSYPIKEDLEKLSLIYHITHSDGEFHKIEEDHVKEELKKEIYNPKSIQKIWKKIQKNPLSLEEIFEKKDSNEKMDLYHLASNIVILDGKITKGENCILKDIHKIAELSPQAISNIHKLVLLDKKLSNNQAFEIPLNLNNDQKEEQIAYSYKLLAEKYFDKNELEKARENYSMALKLYIKLDKKSEIIHCSQLVSVSSLS
ncbi:MAG: AI-2E family transporter, partial [Spirochaetota bacterium]|nr:AI-2E family transporter [Spirochaetota bacterium]